METCHPSFFMLPPAPDAPLALIGPLRPPPAPPRHAAPYPSPSAPDSHHGPLKGANGLWRGLHRPLPASPAAQRQGASRITQAAKPVPPGLRRRRSRAQGRPECGGSRRPLPRPGEARRSRYASTREDFSILVSPREPGFLVLCPFKHPCAAVGSPAGTAEMPCHFRGGAAAGAITGARQGRQRLAVEAVHRFLDWHALDAQSRRRRPNARGWRRQG